MTFKLASRILAFVLTSALLAGTAAGVPVPAADTSGVAAAKGDVPLLETPHIQTAICRPRRKHIAICYKQTILLYVHSLFYSKHKNTY